MSDLISYGFLTPPAVLIVLCLLGGLLALVWRGFSARDNPNAAEVFIARQLRHMAVPRAARQMTNPVPASPEVLAEAMEHFADHCDRRQAGEAREIDGSFGVTAALEHSTVPRAQREHVAGAHEVVGP